MTTTRIRLIGDFFNVGVNAYLELAEYVVVPLNFGVSDIRDVSSKTGSFSKSIQVPGTKSNNQVLDHLFDVNAVTLEFNINRLQGCIIEQDGEVVLDNAVMQLLSVDKVSTGMGNDEQIVYTIAIKDTVSNIFTAIGNKLLTDLDFSDLNHTYTASNVIASFPHTVSDGYKYILPMSSGGGYFLNELKPAIYFEQYVNRIMAMAGYSWEWAEKSLVGFDKLLMPYNGGKPKLSQEAQEAVEVIAENTTPQEFLNTNYTLSPYGKVTVDTEIKDDNGYYNPALSRYTSPFDLSAPNMLTYEIVVDWDLLVRNNEILPVNTDVDVDVLPRFLINTPSGVNLGAINSSVNTFDPSVTVNTDGTIKVQSTDSWAVGDTIIASGVNNLTINCSPVNVGSLLEVGATTYKSVNNIFELFFSTADADFVLVVKSISIRVVPSAESVGYTFPIIMNDYVPENIKQSDFLKSIFTAFNVYLLPDENDANKIILKTRDNFYDAGEVKDWTEKLHKDKQHTITFLPELTAKKLVLTYSKDTDPFNVGYFENVNEIYGQVEYIFDNEFIKNVETKSILFGASPFVDTAFGARVLAINGYEPKTLPRMVYDGGVQSCGYYSIVDTATSYTSVNEYPYVGHFNTPFNPTIDFNFGINDYYFDNAFGVAPFNNLANTYWRRTMAQINDGKMYTVYLDLTAYDIANLKLNDKIYLDRSYWYINRVIDYDANSNSPTKVELISADTDISLPNFPIIKPTRPSKNDTGISVPIQATQVKIKGSSNIDGSAGSVILGNNNVIKQTVRNAIVIGDNQVVEKDGIYMNGFELPSTLSEVLANGNETGGNNIIVTGGSLEISATDGTSTSTETITAEQIITSAKLGLNESYKSQEAFELSNGLTNGAENTSFVQNVYNFTITATGAIENSSLVQNASSSTTTVTDGTNTTTHTITPTSATTTVTDGSDTTTTTQTKDSCEIDSPILKLTNLPTYADNATAITGGLTTDCVYKTATGELRIVI